MKKNIINITDIALKQFRKIMKEQDCKAIYFSLKSGGCNGFEYNLEPTNNSLQKGDELYSKSGVDIQICKKSLIYIIGTEIDWEKNIMGETFKFNNPVAKNSCGCGSSFNPL